MRHLATLALILCFVQRPVVALCESPIDSKKLLDGRHIFDFRAIDSPKLVSASSATFLGDNEYVLGVTINGESRAYPTRFASWHHVINDRVGKSSSGPEAFVTVTY